MSPVIEVVWAEVPAGRLDDATRAGLAADIDARRLGKLDRFHRQVDRDRGLAAHALLRRVLAGILGGKPAEVEFGYRCTGCGSTEHGKPFLPGGEAAFNLSHSGDRVVVALAPPGVAVGVDVEGRRDVDWATLRSSVFGDVEWVRSERAEQPDVERTRLWSRKEAAVKASGHGLTMPMRKVEIEPLPDPDSALTAWSARLAARAGDVSGWDLTLDTGRGSAVHPAGGSADGWTGGTRAATADYAAAVGIQVSGPGVDVTAARAAVLAGFVVRKQILG